MKNYLCCCNKQHDTKAQLVACHRKHSLNDPKCIYDMVGETGDAVTNELVKEIWDFRKQVRELSQDLQKQKVCAKLNMEEALRLRVQLSTVQNIIWLGKEAEPKFS